MAALVAFAHVLGANARDDVIDIFDVVFGDLQHAATNRGQKRRADELRDYDRAVAELHARMQSLLDVLDDDDEAIAAVLGVLRQDRGRIERAMGTVTALMRPPADPFHERLVACYPQIRRFLPLLTRVLDEAWRRTADGFATNPLLRLEQRDGQDRIVAGPLDARDEPASLVCLRGMVEGLLPEVEIADVPLEVHSWTGFLDEYTHVSGAPARAAGLIESVSALLVSDACNLGLTPVADEHYLPLSRERLNWVAQNYLRSETHAGGNTRLVNYHARLALAQAWGGGEMASADGMRFVIPVSSGRLRPLRTDG